MTEAPIGDRMDTLVGRKVGNYVLSERLGEGGMGTVYLARHPDLGIEVAVKVLSHGQRVHPSAAERFLAEARAAAGIDHPSVIRIHDLGQLPEGGLYYVMEALRGRDLDEVIGERGPCAPERALAYLEQICPALQAAHERGIVHRDLKPGNVFVVSEDPLQLKILDFGIAKLLRSHHPDRSRTATGMVMGSPPFMAPEQAAGQSEDIDPRTDLYSLGVILYLLLSGRLPIVADDVTTLMYKQITAAPVPLRQVRPEVPVPVAALVHRCLEKQPADRPASAAALLEAFRAAMTAAEHPTGPPRPAEVRSPTGPPAPPPAADADADAAREPDPAPSRVPLALQPTLRTTAPARRSGAPAVAVLPVSSRVADPGQAYLGDGLAELLTAALAQRGGLRVVSRTSASRFKEASLPLTEIGRRLGVDCIVEGSVLAAGDLYQISVQLIDARDDTHLWACSYERALGQLFAVQAEMAAAIARRLREAYARPAVAPATREETGRQETGRQAPDEQVSPGAFKAYLQARHLWSLRDAESLRRAGALYREAAGLDPRFVLAHCGVVHTQIMLILYGVEPPTEAARACRGNLERVVELAPDHPEVQLARAGVALFIDWDFEAAARLVEGQLRAGVGEPVLHLAHSDLLVIGARLEEAVEAMRAAVRLDPYDPGMNMNLAERLFSAGHHDEALEHYQGILDLIPGFVPCLVRMAPCYSVLGQHDEALALLERLPPAGADPPVLTCRAVVEARAGRLDEARRVHEQLVERASRRYTPACLIARVSVSLGDHRGALGWLERAFAERDPMLIFAGVDHLLRPLHRRPEFAELLQRVGVTAVGPYAGPR